MLLVIDNYDSFTYNLVQYLGEMGIEMLVVRNDEVTVDAIETDLKPERILISPGPGTPDSAGISLGVHQAVRRSVADPRRLSRASGDRAAFWR